jgi:hypothetical protein
MSFNNYHNYQFSYLDKKKIKERKSHMMLKKFKISRALHKVPTSCLYEQSLATITK